jgi:hypothetical protein
VVLELDNDAPPTIAVLRSGTRCKYAVEKNVEPKTYKRLPLKKKTEPQHLGLVSRETGNLAPSTSLGRYGAYQALNLC